MGGNEKEFMASVLNGIGAVGLAMCYGLYVIAATMIQCHVDKRAYWSPDEAVALCQYV